MPDESTFEDAPALSEYPSSALSSATSLCAALRTSPCPMVLVCVHPLRAPAMLAHEDDQWLVGTWHRQVVMEPGDVPPGVYHRFGRHPASEVEAVLYAVESETQIMRRDQTPFDIDTPIRTIRFEESPDD